MEDNFFSESTTTSSFLFINETSSWLDIDYPPSNFSSGYMETGESELLYDGTAYNHLGSRRDALYVVLPITIIYLSIFITGTIGNVSTCIVIARNKSMHTATNYYLFSLAVSDLLLLISGLPVEVYLVWSKYPYIFGEHFCRLRGLAAECSTNATVLTITAFTAERYVAICHPFLSHTMSKLSRAVKLILVVWLVALSFATPMAMQFGIIDRRDLNPDYVMCAIKVTLIKHSFEISTFLFFIVPMILITVLYVMIGLKLRQSNMMKGNIGQNRRYGRASSSTNVPVHSERRDERNCRHHTTGRSSRRVLKMLVAVVVAFFICWAPFHVQRLIAIYGTDDDHVTSKSKWIEFLYLLFTYVSGVLYYVSATINPILYNIMSNKFREAFMETLSKTCGKRTYSAPQGQRSYSSLSRSQQNRGTTGIFGSRNMTGGSAMAHDSSDYSGNSTREENCSRINGGNPGQPGAVETLYTSSIGGEKRLERSSSRKLSVRCESLIPNDTNSRLGIAATNPQVQDGTAQEPEVEPERPRRSRETNLSNNNFLAVANNRENSTRHKSLNGRRRNYAPVAIDTNVGRRKKWWSFLRWLPNAEAFRFRNDGTRYPNSTRTNINDIESYREEYSMTSRCNNNLRNQRLV